MILKARRERSRLSGLQAGMIALHSIPVLALLVLFSSGMSSAADSRGGENGGIAKITRDGSVIAAFDVELADTDEKRIRGLSGRTGLADGRGMLFLLDERIPVAFWMKGMLFPIDIIFADRGGSVTDVFSAQEPCTSCPYILPSSPAAFALEINAGLSEKFGIRKGDTIVVVK